MTDGDPTRLRQLADDLPHELAKGLEDLREEQATATQLRELEVRVRAALGLPFNGAPPAAAGGASSSDSGGPSGGPAASTVGRFLVPGSLGVLAGVAVILASGALGPRAAVTTGSPVSAMSAAAGTPLSIADQT